MFAKLNTKLIKSLQINAQLIKIGLNASSIHCRPFSVEAKSNELNENNEFKYTLNNTKLSSEQRKFYEQNGFILIKKLVAKQDINTFLNRFNDIANRRVETPPGLLVQKEVTVAKELQNENTVYKLQELYADDVLFEYCKYGPVLDYVEGFCGPNIMAIHTMLINKPPDPGTKSSRHPLHQDLHYFPFRPADRIVCAWTAMETINRANGCLVALPGTHKGEHLEHDYPEWEGGVNKFYYGIKGMTGNEERVHIEMEAGDCVLFHPLLIHGSGMNRTKGFRKAISCHFAASECQYIDVRGTLQEKLAEEILDVARKKGVQIDDYRVLWQLRARLVRGKQINL
jgi:phytanoyl-CoA hydroxylase